MAQAVVVNVSGTTQNLKAMVAGKMESVTVPPTLHGKATKIDAHFVTWQKPHPSVIKVLHFIDNSGKKVDTLPAGQIPEARHPTTIQREIERKAAATQTVTATMTTHSATVTFEEKESIKAEAANAEEKTATHTATASVTPTTAATTTATTTVNPAVTAVPSGQTATP